MTWVRFLPRLLGFVLLGLLLTRVPVEQVLGMALGADPALVLLAVVLLVPFFVCKSWRWQLLLRGLGISVSRTRAFALYFVGLFAGYASPGQLGEAVKAVYLKREGRSFAGSMASIVLDRLADLTLLSVLAAAGLAVLGPRAGMALGEAPLATIALAAVICVALALLIGRSARIRICEKMLGSSRVESWRHTWAGLASALPALGGLTLLAYIVHYARYYALLRALRIEMPVGDFVVALSVASLVALLPISLMGIGTRDLALISLFGLYGIPAEAAMAFSTLILLTYLANLLVGFVAWMVQDGNGRLVMARSSPDG